MSGSQNVGPEHGNRSIFILRVGIDMGREMDSGVHALKCVSHIRTCVSICQIDEMKINRAHKLFRQPPTEQNETVTGLQRLPSHRHPNFARGSRDGQTH